MELAPKISKSQVYIAATKIGTLSGVGTEGAAHIRNQDVVGQAHQGSRQSSQG